MSDKQTRNDKHDRRLASVIGFVVCMIVGAIIGDAVFDPESAPFGIWHSVRDDGIRRFVQYPVEDESTEIGKNHQLVKRAFRDAVSPVVDSTVRIMIGGKQVALGFVVDTQGHILTKASEISGPVKCKIGRESSFKAEVVQIDRRLDIALLQSERYDLPPVRFADESPEIGSWVAVPDFRGVLPILVGVVSGRSRFIEQDVGFLGVELEEAPNGGKIKQVIPESSASKFGLRAGDVVYAIDGEQVYNVGTVIGKVRQFRPGDHVTFGIRRDGVEIQRKITLTRRGEVAAAEDGSIEHEGGPLSNRRSGFPEVMQHDCTLKPKQCGGPLVNLRGEVVGMNIARAGRVESFAIPALLIQNSLTHLKSGLN